MTASPEWMDYLRVPLALVFVAGLIFLSSTLVKKMGLDKRLTGNRGEARMHIVETLYLDPRRRLVIVREGENEHVLLLSTTGDVLIASRRGGGTDAS